MPTTFKMEPERSIANLDISPEQSGIFTPGIETIDIHEDKVGGFNAVAHILDDTMPPLTVDQFAGVARRVLRTVSAGGDSHFVRSRMRRATEIRAMASDEAWPIEATKAARIGALLGYIDGNKEVIPNTVPHIGLLDSALLVDISLDGLREELEDYADFCRYRHGEIARCGGAADDERVDRSQWQFARDAELRLEQHLRRVRDATYVSSAAERVFRVF